MKPSHLKTPRTMNDGVWSSGYISASSQEARWEVLAGYALAIVIGVGLAALLFFGASS
jgi:ABC-type nitrate/sulfonate/bicarbonate transport system permease component